MRIKIEAILIDDTEPRYTFKDIQREVRRVLIDELYLKSEKLEIIEMKE